MTFETLKKRIVKFNKKYNMENRWYTNITDALFIGMFYFLKGVSIIAKYISIAGERLSKFLGKIMALVKCKECSK